MNGQETPGYGVGRWIRKPECRNINRTWCDLSNETSDYEEQYYASVKAFLNGMCSDWMETTRFNPLTDNSKVYLTPIIWWFSVSNNTLVVPWLEPGTAYCVSAQIHVTTPLLHSGFSKEYCIATLKDKTTDETITIVFGYVLPVMLAVLSISMTCYCVHRYIHVSKQKHPTNLVWQYTDKCKEKVFIPCEKIVVNLITLNVDEYKPSQESSHLPDGKSPHYYTVYSDTEGKDLPSKELLETKHLLDISHEEISRKEAILVEGDQTGNGPSYGQTGTKNTLRLKNAGVVEYELDVRAEDFSPGQKLEDLSLIEKTSASRGLLGEPQFALEDLINTKTGQPYCPQLESGQTSYPQLEQIAQGLTEKEGGQTILVDWDPHTGRLYIPTLSSVENQVCEKAFKCDGPDKDGILSRLYEKEVSDTSSEDQEMYLLQFKEQWGLHVEMED
ncbi:hypothetical protein llap_17197 [Limosa lapponica baueri]|uniref:Interleukin-20 receptor subunit alpha n=1 Tax=Limosa lapponica baueri TaxID=1758121 RepID=A0A2I0TFC4_LIMLA|nr:hypothetical protein llap_17197 [Limosa lapponica baueri]